MLFSNNNNNNNNEKGTFSAGGVCSAYFHNLTATTAATNLTFERLGRLGYVFRRPVFFHIPHSINLSVS